MKKIFSCIFIISVAALSLSVSAQNLDVSQLKNLSDAQKRAALASLTDADKQRLSKELGIDLEVQDQVALEQPVLLTPRDRFDETLEDDEVEKQTVPQVRFNLNQEGRYEYDESGVYVLDENGDFIIYQEPEVENISNKGEELKRFGYELFSGTPTTFAPATDIPVPQDYILGPGDNVKVTFFGSENDEYSLYVTREGILNVPGLEPVVVSGMSFDRLSQEVADRVSVQKIGVRASITMGTLRSMRIFVLGEANQPGSYTISSLSTMSNALFVSGGVKEIGSLRNVQLKRKGRVVKTLDLYSLLLKGDTRNDVRLEPGDVIFIPTVSQLVSVDGEVKRPAIYEVKEEHHLKDFIELAGGLRPNSYKDSVQVTRFNASGEREITNINYTSNHQYKINGGDEIFVGELLTEIENAVSLEGHVNRAGNKAFYSGMRVSDVLEGFQNLKDRVDLDYALIKRKVPPANTLTVLSFNLGEAIRNPSSVHNVALQKQDTVYVFESATSRAAVLDQLALELEAQATLSQPIKQVGVSGRVKVPGNYPLENGMTVLNLLTAGGGLSEAAYQLDAELTRYYYDENFERKIKHIPVDLQGLLKGDYSADVQLQSSDNLFIKETPNWRDRNFIEIEGEVKFPGSYQIKPGETLGQALQRAGGFTDYAFPNGAIFIRERLKEKEARHLNDLANRLEKDVALLAVQKETNAVEFGQALLDQLRGTEPVGRFVINLNEIVANVGDPVMDVTLSAGDTIYIPEKTQEVTVVGEVQYPASHQYDGISSRNAYVNLSGGYAARADRERVYVIRANGRVVNREYSRWFSRGDFIRMEPGDTIVVPVNVDYTPALQRWQAVTQILSQIGIFAAAANTVGIL